MSRIIDVLWVIYLLLRREPTLKEKMMRRGYDVMPLKDDHALMIYLNKKGRRNIISVHSIQREGRRSWIVIVRERWWKRQWL